MIDCQNEALNDRVMMNLELKITFNLKKNMYKVVLEGEGYGYRSAYGDTILKALTNFDDPLYLP